MTVCKEDKVLLKFPHYIKNGDLQLLRLVNSRLHCLTLDIFMNIVTQLGSLVVAVLVPLCLFFTGKSSLTGVGVQMMWVLTLSQLVVQVLKRLVNRPRPFRVLDNIIVKYPPTCKYSFPSGHTCAAFSLAFVLAGVIPALGTVFYTAASLVGISRVYLGAHYPSDVICGYATAYLTFVFNAHFIA